MALTVRAARTVGDLHLDVDLVAPPGVTALVGPSGAGKSQTLRLVAGLDAPDAGRVELFGRVLHDTAAGVDLPSRRRALGMAFQPPVLLPHRTALANVALAARGPRRRRRADAADLLAAVGAADLADRRAAVLSGGQRQRVALATALARRPLALLLDEPLSALDRPERERLGRVLAHEVTRRGLVAVLVTHDDHEVAGLADHVAHADRGVVRTDAARRHAPATGHVGGASR